MIDRPGFWTRRRAAIAAGAGLAGAGALYLSAHAPQHKQTQPPPRGVLRRGNAAEPDTLDPAISSAIWEDSIIGDLLIGLMTDDADAQPVPGMATSWTISPDGLTWTFTLRQALWSDGVPVTAEDFVFAWRRILDPATGGKYAYFLFFLKNAEAVNGGKMPPRALGVRALDDHGLEVTLEHPTPYLLQMLRHGTMLPEPRHVVERHGKTWTRAGTYVGNGPYTLKEWLPNGHVTLVRNPNFYDAAHVAVEQVVFYPTTDYGAALQRMRAGELDTQDRLPGAQIDWIRAYMPELLHPVPQLILEFISINVRRKPFDDIRVRAALNLVLNREVVTGKILRTGEVPAYNLVPPHMANYPGGVEFSFRHLPADQRVAQAQALMRQAGFGPDKRVKTTFRIRGTTAGASRAAAAAVQQMLSLAYIDAAIIPSEAAIFYNAIQEHDFDLAQSGWNADFADASNFLDLFRTGGGNNWGQYANPAFDAALNAAQSDTALASRGRKLAEAEAILIRDQAFAPLFFWVNSDLVRPYVKGWNANALGVHRTRWVTIDEAARTRLFA
jgi:oligopeptide transport system substrate-binding protein